jgi:NAD(P)-dependent dehydrogenase (short-subunit alcohol dehydrogenase family)
MLNGKVAVVSGAARGVGRAIAVESAANGADVVAIDIADPVSSASDAQPATPKELAETVQQIRAYGRKGEAIRADIRDIGTLRATADKWRVSTARSTSWLPMRHPALEAVAGDGGQRLARRH